MKNICLSIILIIFIVACSDQRDAQITSANGDIEVKFNILKKGTKYPEYELTFYSGYKVIATRVYKNGQTIVSEGVIPDSQVVDRYENGKIRNIIQYKKGMREGKAIGFYQSGKLKIESTYKNDNPNGITKTYYETGQLKSESEIVEGKNVLYKEYHENGKIKEEEYYKNGEGISKIYDINGNPVKY